MIELDVDDICQECEFFEPINSKMVFTSDNCTCGVIHYVRCESKAKCDTIKKKLEAKMRETDEAR